MRSNGLTAATYTPVADLDPAVAETLLDDLKSQGVAAYAKPVEAWRRPPRSLTVTLIDGVMVVSRSGIRREERRFGRGCQGPPLFIAQISTITDGMNLITETDALAQFCADQTSADRYGMSIR